MVSGMDIFHPAMPPFTGTPDERRALAFYIAYGLNGRNDPAPVKVAKKKVAIPAFDPEKDPYVLLAWSTQGIHSIAELDGLFSLLPPGNTLRAQLIQRGETPQIVNQSVTLRYRMQEDYVGEDGKASPSGAMIPEDDVFTADGIALFPFSKQGFDPYPVLIIEARDKDEILLATTKVVTPVSTEMGCSNCHGGSKPPDVRVGVTRETAMNILKAHDRLSATALVSTAQAGTMVRCQSCHADPKFHAEGDKKRLILSASIHGFHANYFRGRGAEACALCHPSSFTDATRSQRDIHAAVGLDCTNCHGVVEDLTLGLLRHEQQASKKQATALMTHLSPRAVESVDKIVPRTPWSNQPDCLHCHVDYQSPTTDTITNTWTGNEQDLYRNRTDESGRLYCAACHSSPHAIYPAENPYSAQLDALQPLQYQQNRLPFGSNRNCAVCHTVAMEDEMHHANTLRDFRNE